MALSNSLKTQFAKVLNASDVDTNKKKVLTGTAVEYAGDIYVQLDGSDQLTPLEDRIAGVKDGDRVTIEIENHSASLTGNLSDPAAGTSTVAGIEDQVVEFNVIIANKADIDQLEAESARIDDLEAENVTISGKLEAVEADIGTLEADNVTINNKLTAAEADIDDLQANKADISVLEAEYATIDQLNATNADIGQLQGDYGEFKELVADDFDAVNATITNLDNKYANIDFSNIGEAAIEKLFADSGIIGDLVMDEGHVTGTLVGVTIKGDLIEGGTVVADKLVILGDDGLYYKLNTNGETIAAEQTEYNSLNGTIITAKSITAEKISVSDLVAFGATIGGFNITDNSLYSGVKSSVMNTTRGVYMNNDGEISLGDAKNYLRFYKASDGTYKLAISAESLTIAATGTSIENAVLSTIEEFYQSTSPTSLAGGSWQTTQPVWTQGKFIFRRTRVTYMNGQVDYTPSANGVCITGNTGEKGDNGDTGKGIDTTTVTYQASSSGTTVPTGNWSSTVPELTTAKPYLWTRTVITYTDKTTSTSYSVSSTLESVEVGGRNLIPHSVNAQSSADWSNWFTPAADISNSCGLDGTFTFPDGTKVGDIFTLSAEFEWTDFTAGTGGTLSLPYIQFYWNDSWGTGIPNVFASRFITAKKEAGSQLFSYTGSITTSAQASGTVNYNFRTNYSDGTGKIRIRKLKLERGNKATDWTPAPEDVEEAVSNAEKVATNYLQFSSANGLVVSNHTASSLGANVQITSSGVNIRKNTTVWSSWTANRLEFFAGGKSALVLTNEPALRLGAYDSHYIYANDTGLNIHNGSTTVSSFHGSTITLGPTSGRHALINSAGLYLRSGTSNIAYFTASAARIYSGAGTDDYLNLGADRLEMVASGASRFAVTKALTRIGNLDGRNVQIDSNSFNIRNGDTVLSNFTSTTINLGNNSSSAIINFCASNASITYNSNYGMLLERNNGALNIFASTYARVRGTTQTQLGDSSGASTTYIMCGSAAGNITLGGANRPIYAYVGSARRQLKQVYRLLNPNTLAYLTTADPSEANGLVAQGWTINNASVYYVFK